MMEHPKEFNDYALLDESSTLNVNGIDICDTLSL